MGWTKEAHGAREFGWRRDDNLAYVGRSAAKWWRIYVRPSAAADFALMTDEGLDSDKSAMLLADLWCDENLEVAA